MILSDTYAPATRKRKKKSFHYLKKEIFRSPSPNFNFQK